MRIINYEELVNHGNIKGRKRMAEIMEAGLSAGNPYNNTRKLIKLEGNTLTFEHPLMEPAGDPHSGPAVFDLKEIDRIFLFGIGKGIQHITKAVEDVLGGRISGGFVIAKHGDGVIMERVEVILAGHPVPDEYCLIACKKLLDMVETAHFTERDLVITATGNGCGSLCTLPAEGITLEDVKAYTYMCQIECGMTTPELSFIRNQIDRIRGGRLLRKFMPARMINLLGIRPGARRGNLEGYEALTKANMWLPLLPDATTAEGALEICKKWNILDNIPASIRKRLLAIADKPNETLSAAEYETMNCRVFGVMPYGLNALNAAMDKACELGFEPHLMTETTFCEASTIGHFMAQIALHIAHNDTPFKAPCALFASGELITTVGDETGIGGTNQEYCLAAAQLLKDNPRVVMSAVDTDGNDGPGGEFIPDATARGITVLAGGMVDGWTFSEASKRGVDIPDAIKRHDSSQALWRLDSGIAAAPTIRDGDLHCTLILPREE